jgi:uncharacterized protein (DUF433 family)
MAVNFDPNFPETEEALLHRITARGGCPRLRAHGLAVERVLAMLADGMSAEAIVRDYAGLHVDDIRACLVYARRLVGPGSAAPAVC